MLGLVWPELLFNFLSFLSLRSILPFRQQVVAAKATTCCTPISMDDAPRVQVPAETSNGNGEVEGSSRPVNGSQPPQEEDSLPDAPNPEPTTPAKNPPLKFLECVSLSPSPLNRRAAPAPMVYPLPSQPGLTSFSFLTSPIVEIVVGQGDNETVLTAHQNLLHDSPFLSELVSNFEASGPVSLHLNTMSRTKGLNAVMVEYSGASTYQTRMSKHLAAFCSSNTLATTPSRQPGAQAPMPAQASRRTVYFGMRGSTHWPRSSACQP